MSRGVSAFGQDLCASSGCPLVSQPNLTDILPSLCLALLPEQDRSADRRGRVCGHRHLCHHSLSSHLCGVTSRTNMFHLSPWDTSAVTNMRFFLAARLLEHLHRLQCEWHVCWRASFNKELASWDVSASQTVIRLLEDSSALNQDLSTWNVASLTGVRWRPGLLSESLASTSVANMFISCAIRSDPGLSATPSGPFC